VPRVAREQPSGLGLVGEVGRGPGGGDRGHDDDEQDHVRPERVDRHQPAKCLLGTLDKGENGQCDPRDDGRP
jgi:hypothetical protein